MPSPVLFQAYTKASIFQGLLLGATLHAAHMHRTLRCKLKPSCTAAAQVHAVGDETCTVPYAYED